MYFSAQAWINFGMKVYFILVNQGSMYYKLDLYIENWLIPVFQDVQKPDHLGREIVVEPFMTLSTIPIN